VRCVFDAAQKKKSGTAKKRQGFQPWTRLPGAHEFDSETTTNEAREREPDLEVDSRAAV
jgi:hypothetical protein